MCNVFIYICVCIYIYIYIHIYINFGNIEGGLGGNKRQISRLVLTYGRFQGNLIESVKIKIEYGVKYIFSKLRFLSSIVTLLQW